MYVRICPVLCRLVLSGRMFRVSLLRCLVCLALFSLCVVCCLLVVLSVVSLLLASDSSLVFPCICVCRFSRLSVLFLVSWLVFRVQVCGLHVFMIYFVLATE